jgi:uncharacterized membrane protein YeaQ/YmgE (transglycosylase-associated protein family)
MLGLIIFLFLFGLVAGAIGRLLVPGRQNIGIFATVLVGLVGSFVGGFLGWAIFDHDRTSSALQPSGVIGSIIGAVIVLLLLQHFGRISSSRRHS